MPSGPGGRAGRKSTADKSLSLRQDVTANVGIVPDARETRGSKRKGKSIVGQLTFSFQTFY